MCQTGKSGRDFDPCSVTGRSGEFAVKRQQGCRQRLRQCHVQSVVDRQIGTELPRAREKLLVPIAGCVEIEQVLER